MIGPGGVAPGYVPCRFRPLTIGEHPSSESPAPTAF